MWGDESRFERSVEERLESIEMAIVMLSRAVVHDEEFIKTLKNIFRGEGRALSGTKVTVIK